MRKKSIHYKIINCQIPLDFSCVGVIGKVSVSIRIMPNNKYKFHVIFQ
jgi:hypothetical protein